VRERKIRTTGERGLCFIVADTGTGIKPENRFRIFEPFFSTKGENGTGLGLWVTKGIVAKHRGTIRVRSRDGEGTVFSMFLPFSQESLPLAESEGKMSVDAVA
jgi:signal transduction histidine kinase